MKMKTMISIMSLLFLLLLINIVQSVIVVDQSNGSCETFTQDRTVSFCYGVIENYYLPNTKTNGKQLWYFI